MRGVLHRKQVSQSHAHTNNTHCAAITELQTPGTATLPSPLDFSRGYVERLWRGLK